MSNVHAIEETEQPSLSALAIESLSAADGDTAQAIDALVKRLLRDRPLLRSVITGAIEDAVRYRTEMAMRGERRAIIREAITPRAPVPIMALVDGLRKTLLDMPLAGGLRLRDATHEQVAEQANRYASISKDTGHKARWLTLVAQSVPDGKTVGEVMDDARAEELFREAA